MRVFAMLVCGVLLAACAADDGPDPPATTMPSVTTAEPTAPTNPASPTASPTGGTAVPDDDPRVMSARRQVHERYGHPPDELELLVFEDVVWSNAALGCPLTEVTYDEADVPGYRVVLGWGDLEFHFHGAAGDTEPAQCQFLDG